MRFLHTGDLHIGKKLHGYDLLEDQQQILQELLQLAKAEKVDALVLAGDLYDRSVPSVEAIAVFNHFISQVNLQEGIPILAISGNHDSGTRLEAGAPWYKQTNFHLHTKLEQAFTPVEFTDTQFFLLPYFEPIAARFYFEDETIRTVTQAMEKIIPAMEKNFDKRKQQVLVAHFFVAGSQKTESETKIEVGGLDSVPSTLLEKFHYVALGHLHNRKALQHERMRYSGSPLKFSLSELNQEKGAWLVELPQFKMTFKAFEPLHEMQQIKASFTELMNPVFYQKLDRESYLEISLTDRSIIPNMMNQLRTVYPRILTVDRINGRSQAKDDLNYQLIRKQSPQELVANFFQEVTNEELTDRQLGWVSDILSDQEIQEGEQI